MITLLIIYFSLGVLAAIYQFGAVYAWSRGAYPGLDDADDDIRYGRLTGVIVLVMWPVAIPLTFIMFAPHKYGWWLWPTREEREAHTKRCNEYWDRRS